MFTKVYSIISTILLAIVVITAIHFFAIKDNSLKQLANPNSSNSADSYLYNIWDKNDVKISLSDVSGHYYVWANDRQDHEKTLILLKVEDGKRKSLNFYIEGDLSPIVEMVTDDFIVMNIIAPVNHGPTVMTYVINRKTQEVKSIAPSMTQEVLTVNNDATRLAIRDESKINNNYSYSIVITNLDRSPIETLPKLMNKLDVNLDKKFSDSFPLEARFSPESDYLLVKANRGASNDPQDPFNSFFYIYNLNTLTLTELGNIEADAMTWDGNDEFTISANEKVIARFELVNDSWVKIE